MKISNNERGFSKIFLLLLVLIAIYLLSTIRAPDELEEVQPITEGKAQESKIHDMPSSNSSLDEVVDSHKKLKDSSFHAFIVTLPKNWKYEELGSGGGGSIEIGDSTYDVYERTGKRLQIFWGGYFDFYPKDLVQQEYEIGNKLGTRIIGKEKVYYLVKDIYSPLTDSYINYKIEHSLEDLNNPDVLEILGSFIFEPSDAELKDVEDF